MDRGAHFHRCDFQVHTPRDRQWSGPDAVTDDERRLYARSLVRASREKGLQGIGITDHHDLVFYRYVREAAASELDDEGRAIPKRQQLAVFPGMELTLGLPCQALLLFDADLPTDLFSLALNALAITPAAEVEPKTAQTTRLINLTNLKDVCSKLDAHEYLRGRYILLPNVNEGGGDTLLRQGFAAHYQTMPCVGGYVDGSVTQHGIGNNRIVNGKDQAYGSKRIAVFQTSDNRSSQHDLLGTHSTWVKWAAPSAEALRQACLAQESRISQVLPNLPEMALTSLGISNSKFMGPVELELNPQYTALIGGRGTGKSTLLEYLRWCLCDQPPVSTDTDDLPNYQARRRALIERTLVPFEATVEVRFLVNQTPHVIRRSSKSGQLLLKIASAEFVPCGEEDVRSLLPIDAYSQKQLSNVGVRLDELGRFVESPIRRQLDDLAKRFRAVGDEVRQRYAVMQRKRSSERSIANDELKLRSLKEQLEGVQKSLKGLNEEDQQCIADKGRYGQSEQTIEEWQRGVARTRDLVRELTPAISTFPSKPTVDLQELPESALLLRMQVSVEAVFDEVRQKLRDVEAQLDHLASPGSEFGTALQQWNTLAKEFDVRFEAAKGRASAHEAKLKELAGIDARLRETSMAISERKAEVAAMGNPEARYDALRTEWSELYAQRGGLLDTQCAKLTELSHDEIRATVKRGAGIGEVIERVKKAVTGSGMRASKLDALAEAVAGAPDPMQKWHEILGELELLANYEPKVAGEQSLPATPMLSQCGATAGELVKMAAKFGPEQWLDVSLVPVEDRIEFEYRSREAEYIPFGEASAGQQATALLSVLLNQPGPPLIIDQPEDDLDNQVILEVVEKIWDAKKRRQLIFASHNANLVVNGDAELVVACDYRVAGDHSGGKIKSEGAIDMAEIRTDITRVMEGGEDAFKLRRDKYGF